MITLFEVELLPGSPKKGTVISATRTRHGDRSTFRSFFNKSWT